MTADLAIWLPKVLYMASKSSWQVRANNALSAMHINKSGNHRLSGGLCSAGLVSMSLSSHLWTSDLLRRQCCSALVHRGGQSVIGLCSHEILPRLERSLLKKLRWLIALQLELDQVTIASLTTFDDVGDVVHKLLLITR